MADGKILFCLLPLGCLFGAREELVWRRDELLAKHTLLSVISLPEDLFYPAAMKQVAAVIVKKGVPHPAHQSVFWGMIAHDGQIISKSKRLPATEFVPPREEPDQLPEILPPLKAFLATPAAAVAGVPKFYKAAPIDFQDPLLELIPEAYIDGRPPTLAELREAVDELARETVSYLVRFRKESEAEAFK